MVYTNKIEKDKELKTRVILLRNEIRSGSIYRGELACPDHYVVNELNNILYLLFDNDNYVERN
jgi:hypothetical protein